MRVAIQVTTTEVTLKGLFVPGVEKLRELAPFLCYKIGCIYERHYEDRIGGNL